MKKDKIMAKLQKTEKDRNAFLELKKDYFNEMLSDFVRNKDAIGIVEYKNHLYRKIDPIYYDAEPKFLKSHFYAPRKNIFSTKISTFWINIIVLWVFTITLFITLYFNTFAHLVNQFSKLSDKLFGEKE